MAANRTKIAECKHFRIRDKNAYELNVENYIEYIEKKFNVDFLSFPNSKQIIERLHAMTTDCKRKIQDSKRRKFLIIDKIYSQSTRPSPFELTDNLSRTAKRWQLLEEQLKKRKVSLKPEPEIIKSATLIEESSEETGDLTAHPNTEVVSSHEMIPSLLKIEAESETRHSSLPCLPAYFCSNQHKLISPLSSQFSNLSHSTIPIEPEVKSEIPEWLLFEPTRSVMSNPKIIIIRKRASKERIVTFSVINCTNNYMHIRFKYFTEKSPFCYAHLWPILPQILYPGIPVHFKMTFKLKAEGEAFISSLFFIVGHNVITGTPVEAFCIPIESRFLKWGQVSVSHTICMPPIYPWDVYHCDHGYQTTYVYVSVHDNNHYYLTISKYEIDFSKESSTSLVSLEVEAPGTESIIERTVDKDVKAQSKVLASSEDDSDDEVYVKAEDVVAFVVEEILTLSLDVFVFDNTYLYLEPFTKIKIPVRFTKAEHVGKHQCYYKCELSDPWREELILTKYIRVFAEVIPSPIRVEPVILDMTNSPVTHGYCEDHFTIINTHRIYPVTIKILLSTKMKKVFHVYPMETLLPTDASVPFIVRFCTRDFTAVKRTDELVHFTFKIKIIGHTNIYRNAPPIYYEIIAPCATYFKKVYSKKYFKEVSDKSQLEIDEDVDLTKE